jgi:hypothetical protein
LDATESAVAFVVVGDCTSSPGSGAPLPLSEGLGFVAVATVLKILDSGGMLAELFV